MTSDTRPAFAVSRLYLRIYVALVASIFVSVALSMGAWRLFAERDSPREAYALLAEMAQGVLPARSASTEEQQRALEALSERVRADLALYDPAGERIARTGRRPMPTPEPGRTESGPIGGPGPRASWALSLPDGRWLVARAHRPPRNPVLGIATLFGILTVAIAVAAFPIARRLTRRIERLQKGVEDLGAGNLAARVKVEGRDEVGALAASFNSAAERIEALVSAHRTMLANASHELRSPLARIRMSLESLKGAGAAEVRDELRRDIAELDQLIDEILLASRLDALPTLDRNEPVDLLALAAEECARAGAGLDGAPVTVNGDPRLLRRLIRNLLDNARRHGGGETSVAVHRDGAEALLAVCDRGSGVPEAERERIFEPFYRRAGTSEQSGGVGLGLSLVRSIARRHDGEAHCVPRSGGGSCFEVRLPAA